MRIITLIFLVICSTNHLKASTFKPPQDIYAQLLTDFFGVNDELPEFCTREIDKTQSAKGHVAQYCADENLIIIEKKAVEICRKMGKDYEAAIIFLIGHELSHFFHPDHHTKTCFQFIDDEFDEKETQEDQADIFGAFLTYIMGYDGQNIIPELLERIYAGYTYEIKLYGYPPRDYRQESIKRAIEQAEHRHELYDFANQLLMIGEYEKARAAYQHLMYALKFEAKELHNNIGLSYLSEALGNMRNEGQICYSFPFEIDPHSPVKKQKGAIDTKELLILAHRNFRRIRKINYLPARLNTIACYILEGNAQTAGQQINELYRLNLSSTQKATLHILKGIQNAQSGQRNMALSEWDNAIKKSDSQLIRVVSEKNKAALDFPCESFEPHKNTQPISIPNYKPIHTKSLTTTNVSAEYKFQYGEDSTYTYFKLYSQTGHDKIVQAKAPQDGQASPQGISVGDSDAEILTQFESTDVIIFQYPAGYYIVSPKHQIVYKITNNTITKWLEYSIHQ